MTDYVKVAEDLADGMAELGKVEPDTMAAFKALMGATAGKEGVLSVKMKELIALAIAITVRCDGCVGHHAKLVFQAGATEDEVVETIGVAQLMGGGPSTVYGVEALTAFRQFRKAAG